MPSIGLFVGVGLAWLVEFGFGGKAGNKVVEGRLVGVIVVGQFFEDFAEASLDEVDHGAVLEGRVAEVGRAGDLLLVEPAGNPLG
jgi:hypothetical protein